MNRVGTYLYIAKRRLADGLDNQGKYLARERHVYVQAAESGMERTFV